MRARSTASATTTRRRAEPMTTTRCLLAALTTAALAIGCGGAGRHAPASPAGGSITLHNHGGTVYFTLSAPGGQANPLWISADLFKTSMPDPETTITFGDGH